MTTNIDKSKMLQQSPLLVKVTAYVKDFMNKYDGSHDFAHVQRVLGLALKIATHPDSRECDLEIVTLSALLHDVGDRKYLKEGEDSTTMVKQLLSSFGADAMLASKVQIIVTAVSYSHEVQNFELVQKLIDEYPELGCVQDADRLDAIGAIGIGRLFTFGGAHRGRPLNDSMELFDIKLEKLEGMMKTMYGKELARERTSRLNNFKAWWADEEECPKTALAQFGFVESTS